MQSHKKIVIALTILLGSLSLNSNASAAEVWPDGETFGDWTARCRFDEDPIVTCVMTQIATVSTSGERLMRINVFYKVNYAEQESEAAESTLQITLPLGISLIHPPQLLIDGSYNRDANIDVCLADGCYGTIELEPQLLEDLLKMQNGQLILKAGNGDLTELPISGAGSRAAYNAMLTNSRILIDE